ncbi:MAG: hypothetical protein JEY91_16030, partial [Spirochaetaceae bacterium]|nr:hypothetical protein [Spirochaetaceae bacterium]
MYFRLLIKKSALRILPFAAIYIFALNGISLIDNSGYRIFYLTASVFLFSGIMLTILYLIYRKMNKSEVHSEHNEMAQPQTIQPQTIQPQTIQPQTIQPPVL